MEKATHFVSWRYDSGLIWICCLPGKYTFNPKKPALEVTDDITKVTCKACLSLQSKPKPSGDCLVTREGQDYGGFEHNR